ncbi:hypothetical protein [Saccharopolyspora taberi]
MRINSRTLVSVVGTVSMVLATIVLAAWSPAQPQPPAPVSSSTILVAH